MAEFSLFIPIAVEPKQSMRFTKTGRRYQPAKIRKNADMLASHIKVAAGRQKLRGPIKGEYIYYEKWRKNETAKAKREGSQWRDTRPDLGNLDKQLEDAIEASGIIENDARIVWRDCKKVWSRDSGVFIFLEELE